MIDLQGLNSVPSRRTTDWDMLTPLANKYLLKLKPISYGKITSQSMCIRTYVIC